MIPPSPPPSDKGRGGSSAKKPSASFGRIFATYAEKENLSVKAPVSEVIDALTAAVAPDADLVGPPLTSDTGDAIISFSSESAPPGEISSDASIDVSELAEPLEENLEGKEYSREVDHSGMRDQFLAAGGSRSDTPPPPTETNTSSSLSDLKCKEIQDRLKTDFGLEIQAIGEMPMAMLIKVEGVIFRNSWPNEDSSRRILRILLTAIDPQEYDRPEVLSSDLNALKKAFKAELDNRRLSKTKKRKGPPPLPNF